MAKVNKWWLCVATLLVFVADVASQINAEQVIPLDPKVKIGRLANGLTY